MINVPVQQSQKRFQSIPDELQDAFFSQHNIEIVEKVAEENSLSKEQRGALDKLVGYVLLGFLDYKDELQREITASLGIKTEDAKKISDALFSRIFSSLRGELSLAYQPLSMAEGKGLPFRIGAIPPARIETVDKAVPATPTTQTTPTHPTIPTSIAIPAGAVAPTTAFVGSTANKPAAISVGSPLPPAPPQPATSDLPTGQAGKRQATSLTPTTLPTSPTNKTTPASPKTPAFAQASAGKPAPFILHQETESQPLAQQKSKLSFQFTPSKDALQKDMGKPIEILKPKAQIEIGAAPLSADRKSQIPSSDTSPSVAQRIVHYSPFRTPVYAPPPAIGEAKVESSPASTTTKTSPTPTTSPAIPTAPTRPTIPSSPKFITDRFANPAISARPASPAVPTAPSLPTSPSFPAHPISPTSPTPATSPAAPPKMADIIAADKPFDTAQGKPAPTTPQPPVPAKRVDY